MNHNKKSKNHTSILDKIVSSIVQTAVSLSTTSDISRNNDSFINDNTRNNQKNLLSDDSHIAQLIVREANSKQEHQKKIQHEHYLQERNRERQLQRPITTNTNKRFLSSILQSTHDHNQHIIKRNEQSAKRKLNQILSSDPLSSCIDSSRASTTSGSASTTTATNNTTATFDNTNASETEIYHRNHLPNASPNKKYRVNKDNNTSCSRMSSKNETNFSSSSKQSEKKPVFIKGRGGYIPSVSKLNQLFQKEHEEHVDHGNEDQKTENFKNKSVKKKKKEIKKKKSKKPKSKKSSSSSSKNKDKKKRKCRSSSSSSGSFDDTTD